MKKIISLLMCLVLCVVPMSAMAEVGSSASLEAILEIEPENMTYDQYFMFEHGFHSDEESANATLLSRKTKDGDSLLTQNAGAVYADGRRVSGYVGNSEMVFYMVGNSIYRYHVKSQRTDLIYQGNGIVTWYPITSKVLLIGKNSNGLSTMSVATSQPTCTDSLDENNLTYYEVDIVNQTVTIADDPEWDIFLTQGDGYTDVPNFHCTINGKAIPMSEYPVGTQYEESSTDSFGCAAFARDVYTALWGNVNYGGPTEYIQSWTLNEMKSHLQTAGRGSRVRVCASSNDGHSFILCAHDSSAVTVYHANWGTGTNIIHLTRFTYSQLYSYYPSLDNIFDPT